jgi:hypothetical protein
MRGEYIVAQDGENISPSAIIKPPKQKQKTSQTQSESFSRAVGISASAYRSLTAPGGRISPPVLFLSYIGHVQLLGLGDVWDN